MSKKESLIRDWTDSCLRIQNELEELKDRILQDHDSQTSVISEIAHKELTEMLSGSVAFIELIKDEITYKVK